MAKVPDHGHRFADKKLAALTKRLQRSYRQASLNLREKISAYMEQFEKEDAEQRALYDSGELSHEDYMAWRMRKIAGTKQWRDMLNQLTTDLVNADRIAASMIRDELPEVYAENHNYGTYEIEHDLQMSTSYTLYNRDAVRRLLMDDPDLLPQPRVNIPKDERWNRQHLQSAVTQGILTGESMKNIAKRFQTVADMDRRAAIRNARTAVTGAENAGKLDSMKRAQGLGVQLKKLWLATRDQRTRDSHVMLDGELRETDEPFSNGLMYPGDPDGAPAEVYNCRCAMRSKVAGADPYSPNLSRNRRLGGMSYEQWKQEAGERFYSKLFSEMNPEQNIEELSYEEYIEEFKKKGFEHLTEEEIKTIGKRTIEEYQKEFDKISAEYEAENQEYKRLTENNETEIRKLQDKLDAMAEDVLFSSDSQTKKTLKETMTGLEKKLEELKSKSFDDLLTSKQVISARALKNTLTKVRSMGITDEKAVADHLIGTNLLVSNKKEAQILLKAYDMFPTDWINRSVSYGKMLVSAGKRGYYSNSQRTLQLDGVSRLLPVKSQGRAFTCAIHELGHRFEWTIPYLRQEEVKFYKRRTDGEKLEHLKDLVPNGKYESYELTKKDNFIDPYMGKYYRNDTYELVSMGFEYAYTDPEKLAKDPDMQQWIFGLLVTL